MERARNGIQREGCCSFISKGENKDVFYDFSNVKTKWSHKLGNHSPFIMWCTDNLKWTFGASHKNTNMTNAFLSLYIKHILNMHEG